MLREFANVRGLTRSIAVRFSPHSLPPWLPTFWAGEAKQRFGQRLLFMTECVSTYKFLHIFDIKSCRLDTFISTSKKNSNSGYYFFFAKCAGITLTMLFYRRFHLILHSV